MADGDARLVRSYLIKGERPVAVVQWHPVRLAKPTAVAVLAAAPLAALLLYTPVESTAFTVVGVLLLGVLAWWGWHFWEWHVERLVITDRRVMLVTGLLTRKVAMMPLKKVTDMTFERPLLGRLFGDYGWGTFVLESAGQDQALHRIPNLRNPEELYRCVSSEIFGGHGGNATDDDDDDGTGSSSGRSARRPRRREPTTADGSRVVLSGGGTPGDEARPWWVSGKDDADGDGGSRDEPGRDPRPGSGGPPEPSGPSS